MAEQEKTVGAYKYVFRTSQGLEVIEDLKNLGDYYEPLCGSPIPDDRTILVRAVWRDIVDYIEAMANSQGE